MISYFYFDWHLYQESLKVRLDQIIAETNKQHRIKTLTYESVDVYDKSSTCRKEAYLYKIQLSYPMQKNQLQNMYVWTRAPNNKFA